jgi:hypothetical protein
MDYVPENNALNGRGKRGVGKERLIYDFIIWKGCGGGMWCQ